MMNKETKIISCRFYLLDYTLGRIHTAHLDNLLFEIERFIDNGIDKEGYLETSFICYVEDSNLNSINHEDMLIDDGYGDVIKVNPLTFYSHSLTTSLETLSEHLENFINNKHSTIIEGFDHMDWRFEYYLTHYTDEGELVIERRTDIINIRWMGGEAEVSTYPLLKERVEATPENIREYTHLVPEEI